MSIDNLKPNGEVGESSHFNDLLLEELAKTSDRPLEDLTLGLKMWIESQKGYKGNGERRKFIEAVTSRVEAEDPLGAAMLFIDKKSPIPLIGSVDRTLRDARTILTLFFSAISSSEKGGVLLREEPSPTFKLGGAAHLLMEKLVVAGENLEEVIDKKVEPLAEGDNIVGMAIHNSQLAKDKYGNIKIVKAARPSGQKTMPGFEVKPQENHPVLKIKFSDPIPIGEAFRSGQSLSDWSKDILTRSLYTMGYTTDGLPKRPSDVEKIFDDPVARTALMQAVEVGHIFFGCGHNLSQVSWTGNSEGEIRPENVDMFAALNWLAIFRKVIETQPAHGNGAILTEIKEGQLTFEVQVNGNGERLTVPIQGNKIDALRITAPDELKSKRVPTWGIAEVSKYIEGVFNTQEVKHRTYRFENGVRKLRATRFQRNVRSWLVQLHEHFGNDIFRKIWFDIDDFKFLGGDGNWSEQYDPAELPVKEHQRQVSGYIFKVLSQLCWLEKWINTEGESSPSESKLMSFPERDEITLSVEEVIDFGLRTELLGRIRGHLLYQLPAKEIVQNVFPTGSSRDELIEWALGVSKLGTPKTEQRDRLRIARALLTILRPSTGDPEIKRREPKALPESLTGICFNHRGKFYLSIEDLDNLISRRVNFKELEHFSAMEFTRDAVRVIWIKGLVDGEGTIRIAVNGNGEFAISGLKSGIIKGRLLSKRANWGVHERTEKLSDLYETHIWGATKFWGLPEPVKVNNYLVGDEIITPGGKREKLVQGKPIVCVYDLMTGRWRLDQRLLQYAIDKDAGTRDIYGLHELGSLLSRRKTKRQIFCPLPTHANVETKAAHLYPGYIKCYSAECGESIFVPSDGKIKVETRHRVNTQTIKDYKPVTGERTATFSAFMDFAGAFAQVSDVPARYLIHERGVSPSDIGPFGYIPKRVNALLEDIIRTEAFKAAIKRIEHKSDYHIGNVRSIIGSSVPDGGENPLPNLDELMAVIDDLPQESQEKALEALKLDSLLAMKRRGIFEPGTEEKGIPSRHHIGERIIFPTYWISGQKSGPRLVQANFEARGIVLDGERRFRNQDHHKAILTGREGNQTPTGFYFRDPERFFWGVTDTVVVVEGPITAASLFRIVPQLTDITLTNVGVGHNELIAFLRWMGVHDDPAKPKDGLNRGIRKVYLASDFDLGGAVNYVRNKNERLGPQFPNLQILPIHELLPQEIREILPKYDPGLFDKNDGILKGFKLDLNDLLRRHDPDWEEKYKIDQEKGARIAEIRAKYAYFRPS